MKLKTMIPLIMGVAVGGVAIKLVVDVVGNAQAATAANRVQCVVAKMDIDFAEEVTTQKLVLKDWPKDSLPAQYFSDVGDLKNRVSSVFIPKDVPIYPSMLAPPGTPPGIHTRIDNGYRAVSIAIDEVTGVAYQVKPGDRVDVVALVRHQVDNGSRSQTVSRIILQNVEVAAVGRTINPGKGNEGSKSVARSVTLLLTPEEVTELHLAQSLGGRLALALRGTKDEEKPDSVAATTDNLLGEKSTEFVVVDATPTPPVQPPEPAPVAPAPRELWSVTVLNGNDIEIVEFENINGRWQRRSELPAGQTSPEPPVQPSATGSEQPVDFSIDDKDYSEGT